MYIQIEQHGLEGERFFARLRNHESVFMWADFFSEADARRWANAHLEEAKRMEKESDETWPGGAKNAHLGRPANVS